MATVPEATLAFLRDLAENNDTEWFRANKGRYERDLKAPARALTAEVNARLLAISPDHAQLDPNKALSRINRDIRFSKDKSPYNTRVWAGFHNRALPDGHGAGFFFGFSPTSVGIGCGAWQPPPPALASLRAWLALHHARLTAAIAALPAGYGPLDGEKLKRTPKPWTDDHPAAEYLKHKGMHIRIELPADVATRADFVDVIDANFRALAPVVACLDEGMRG